MVRQLDSDTLEQGGGALRRLASCDGARVPATAVISDREVPVFACLRSTMGLPHNNSSWWPEQPARRRRDLAPAGAVASDHRVYDLGPASRGRHASSGLRPVRGDAFALPTVALLERTLAGLRAWSGAPASGAAREAAWLPGSRASR